MSRRALIVANGDLPHSAIGRTEIERADFVLAADGGLSRMLAVYGIAPDAVLGDFDSVAGPIPDGVARFDEPSQDATDLEKSIRRLQSLGYDDIGVIGATGDRLDHTFGAIRAVCLFGVRLIDSVGVAERVRGPGPAAEFATVAGRTVSLMPCGPVEGLTTSGLRWELTNERFDFPLRDGTSNVAAGERVRVSLAAGVIVVYIHHAASPG